jgi:ABC-type uncharacterized transport system permease subunit
MTFFASKGVLWIALGLYTIGLLYALWRLSMGLEHKRWPKFTLIGSGFVLHTLFLYALGSAEGRCPIGNVFEMLNFTSCCLVGLHLLVTAFFKINYLTVFYMPLVLMIQLGAMIIPASKVGLDRWAEGSWLGLHASVIVLGYASFGLAGAVALMYLFQEWQLKHRRLGPGFMLLPPIMRLEWIQGKLVLAGFALLSTGLLAGFVGIRALGLDVTGDPKLLWSLFVWLLYFGMIIGRRLGVSQRSLSWLCVSGFVFVLATFWISNAVSNFHRN